MTRNRWRARGKILQLDGSHRVRINGPAYDKPLSYYELGWHVDCSLPIEGPAGRHSNGNGPATGRVECEGFYVSIEIVQRNEDRILGAPPLRTDRRRARRVRVRLSARVRPCNFGDTFEEVRPTLDMSRDGIYFITEEPSYKVHMHLYVSCPASECRADSGQETGRVVRIDSLESGRRGVAVSFLRSPGFHCSAGFPSGR